MAMGVFLAVEESLSMATLLTTYIYTTGTAGFNAAGAEEIHYYVVKYQVRTP